MPTIKQSLILILALCAGLYGTDTFAALACQVPGNPGNNFLDGSGSGDSPQVCNAAPAAVETELPSEAVGNPINVVTGNKYQADVDLRALPGLLGLEITRHYNSQTNYHGWFGYGWSFSYETFLQASVDAKALHLRQADGRRIGFVLNSKNNRYLTQLPSDGYVVKTKIGYEWSWPQGRKLRFNEKGFLQAIIESGGEMVTLSYDLRNRLNQIRDPQGRTIRFLQDAKGHIIEAQTPVGTYKYNYDRIGNLVAVFDPSGKPRQYSYEDQNNSHLLTAITNRLGITYARFGYDRDGKANFSTHSDGVEKVSIRYENDKSVLINSKGGETVYRYKVIGDLPVLTDVTGVGCSTCGPTNVRYQYNNRGQLTAVSTADITTQYEYDQLGRLVERSRLNENRIKQAFVRYRYGLESFRPSLIEQPSVLKGKLTQIRITYTTTGQPQEIFQTGYTPDGQLLARSTRYQYDSQGRLISVDGPAHESKHNIYFSYDTSNRIVQIKRPDSQSLQYSYDSAGRVKQAVLPGGIAINVEYNNLSRISSVSKAGIKESYWYDDDGRLSQALLQTGQRLFFGYDNAQRLAWLTDIQNNRIKIERDSENKLIRRTLLNPDGTVAQKSELSRYYVDPGAPMEQNPARTDRLVDPNGNLTQVRWTQDGLPGAILEPSGLVTRFAYDRHKLVEVVDPRQLKTGYLYDDFGRLVSVTSPDSGTTHFSYDDADKLVEKKIASGQTIKYRYDNASRVIEQLTPEGKTTVTYGPFGRPTRITYPNGEDRYEYDKAGHLVAHTNVIDNRRFITRYIYDQRGQVTQKILPDGQVLTYQYQGAVHLKAGLLKSISRKDWLGETTLLDGLNDADDGYAKQSYELAGQLTYTRELDPLGNITKLGVTGAWKGQYQPNSVGQISGRTSAESATNYRYRYDPLGRLTGIHGNQKPLFDFNYDQSGNLNNLSHDQTNSRFLVNEASNRILSKSDKKSFTLYSYNEAGSLSQVGTKQYVWDSQQRLTKILDRGIPVAEYQYNAFGERIKKISYSGNQKKVTYFFFDGNHVSAEADDSGRITRQYIWLDDQPIALLIGKKTYAVVADHTHAPRAVVDEKKHVVWRAESSGFGPEKLSIANQIELNLRGSNQYFDAESGLHYNIRRYFDPETGRYLSTDPKGQAGGLNLYAFAHNNPLSYVDGSGLDANPVAPQDPSGWSFEQRLKYVFNQAALQLPGDVGNALKDLVAPQNLATTAVIFGAWAAAQATPAGWIADLAFTGLGLYYFGHAIIDILTATVEVARVLTGSVCSLTQLDGAASKLSKGLSNAVSNITASAGVGAASKIGSLLRTIYKKKPNAAVPTSPQPPPKPSQPPKVVGKSLSSLVGQQIVLPPLSRVGPQRNDGALGEQLAKQILDGHTGDVFRSIQNGSGNGADLVRINYATRTIEHVEVKSSQVGSPGWPSNLANRFDGWISDGVNGKIAGKQIDASSQAFAKQIDQLRNQGFSVEHRVMQVVIPGANVTGNPVAVLKNWP